MATGADPAQPSGDEDSGALVGKIAAGGEPARAAEAALCRRYGPRIQLYGMRHLSDAELAHDLVQIVLLAVLEAARAGRVREPGLLERFILGTCRNTAIRLRQKQGRATPTESKDLALLAGATEEPETVDGRALSRCVDRLDARARKVVTLAFTEERQAEEIARALDTTAGNVRVIRHRALAALRACLDGKREDPS